MMISKITREKLKNYYKNFSINIKNSAEPTTYLLNHKDDLMPMVKMLYTVYKHISK